MKIILIVTVEESQLYLLNIITQNLRSLVFDKPLLLDLVFIAKKPIEDNFLFLQNQFHQVHYSFEKKELKDLKKNSYDYLISLETTLKGLYLSRFFTAKSKVSFNRFWGSLFFNRTISRATKKNSQTIQIVDVKKLMNEMFGVTKDIYPSFFFDDEFVQKNNQMAYWIFKTSHSFELDQEKYILLDFSSSKYLIKSQLIMIAEICNRLLEPIKIKIILVSNKPNLFDEIDSLLSQDNRTNFLYTHQNHISIMSYFPLYKHALLIVTNKKRLFRFFELMQKPVYLINTKKNSIGFFFNFILNPKKEIQLMITQTVGEINYILKSLQLNK
jgi:hypothetical protein